jgi:hypothetical protein
VGEKGENSSGKVVHCEKVGLEPGTETGFGKGDDNSAQEHLVNDGVNELAAGEF